MTDRTLRAVKAGEAPAPAKKAPTKRAPRKFTHAAKLSRKTMLEGLRDRLATAIDDPKTHPRDLAVLTKQFLDIADKLDALAAQSGAGKKKAEPSAIANTPNEVWDEDAV